VKPDIKNVVSVGDLFCLHVKYGWQTNFKSYPSRMKANQFTSSVNSHIYITYKVNIVIASVIRSMNGENYTCLVYVLVTVVLWNVASFQM
jgi:hypothetical protein